MAVRSGAGDESERRGGQRSFLRWAGSKRALLPRLLSYWGAGYRRYVEPFAGSAALFFAIRPRSALLGDINRELVDAFTAVREDPDGVYRAVMRIPLGRESYLTLRQLDTSGLSLTERAARFVFLNRFCFNGLYRTNMRGQFNVPYAPGRTGGVPEQDVFRTCARALARADLHCADFGELLEEARAGDFYYLDPPYATSGRRVFREYTDASFGVADLGRLAEGLKMIQRKGATFLVSYAYCPEALALSEPWHARKVRVQRNIAGFSQHRRRAYELLVSSAPLSCGAVGKGAPA